MSWVRGRLEMKRLWWRRLWCPHYYEMEYGLLDLCPYTTWRCVRGCGRRKRLLGNEIPFGMLLPGEPPVRMAATDIEGA